MKESTQSGPSKKRRERNLSISSSPPLRKRQSLNRKLTSLLESLSEGSGSSPPPLSERSPSPVLQQIDSLLQSLGFSGSGSAEGASDDGPPSHGSVASQKSPEDQTSARKKAPSPTPSEEIDDMLAWTQSYDGDRRSMTGTPVSETPLQEINDMLYSLGFTEAHGENQTPELVNVDDSDGDEEDNYRPSDQEDEIKNNPSGIPDSDPFPFPIPSPDREEDPEPPEELERKITSIFELWTPVLLQYETLGPKKWLDYALVNYVLLRFWYSEYPNVKAGYLDSYSFDLNNTDQLWRVEAFGLPRFRRRFFLPLHGPCPIEPKVFVLRAQEHFFAVYMDHAQRSVTVLGRTSNSARERWEVWNGPEIYRHVCFLHGWEAGSTSTVSVRAVTWNMNGFDCGPVAIMVAKSLIVEGYPDQAPHTLRVLAQSCHHTTRLHTFLSLKEWLRDSLETYNYFLTHPPEEWSSFSMSDAIVQYNPVDPQYLECHRQLQSNQNATLQALNADLSACRRCMKNSRGRQFEEMTHSEDGLEANPRERSEPLPLAQDLVPDLQEVPDADVLDAARTRRLHMIKVNWNEMNIERRRRIARPCDLPLPARPLWLPHDPFFDDYYGGPTKEDGHAFEDPIYAFPMYDPMLSSIFIKSPWTTCRDRGYRLLPRFAHSYYMGNPLMLENHIMPIVKEYDGESSRHHFQRMHLEPRPIGRTGIPELRVVTSTDVEILGAQEMLDGIMKDGKEDPSRLLSYFVRGKTNSGDFVCVDLERDAIDPEEISVSVSVDIDSFIWVTREIKVSAPVGLMVTPSLRNNSGIRKHNHVYVEVLEPPTEEEAGQRERPWLERRVPICHIPHTLFAKITEGNSPIYAYIFFPRMMHRDEYTKKRVTFLPLEILVWFWNHVVLPALRFVIDSTDKEPFYEFSVNEYTRKRAGKKVNGDDSLYAGHCKQVDQETFQRLQSRMREILNSHDDTQQVMDRFKSFFFVVECKGFKLNVISDHGEAVMNKLKHNVPQMDWDYVLQRHTGSEVHMDVAFTYHPRRINTEGLDKEKVGVMGLWRMDYLEESFGKGGFMAGTSHHLNTLAKFGALQAEMTKERSRRTHVLNRISYNLIYEAVRKKDNDPWFCGDGDAYNMSETFLKACEEKQKQYENRGSRSYGVRDEYRVSGMAAIEILTKSDDVFKRFKASGGVIYLPTHLWFAFVSARLSALEIAISYVGRKDPDNKGVVIGVLMNLIRSIESTPTEIPSHVRESKAALLTRAIVATHGMMFLHKLDLREEATETLPDVRQKDTQEVLDELKVLQKKRTARARSDPKGALSVRYPLGSAPTWTEVKETLKRNPLLLIRAWELPTRIDHVPTSAGILFVKFTKSIWASIKSTCIEGSGLELDDLNTLDLAMEFWSAHSVKCVLKDAVFLINRSGIRGAAPGGKEAKSFRERTQIYFPEEEAGCPPRGSKWAPFFMTRVGYIKQYQDKLKGLGSEEQKERLRNGLEDLFAELQCLPDSEAFGERKEGKTWGRIAGGEGIAILVNANHMKFQEIGRVRQGREGPKRSHVTKANKEVVAELYKQHGLIAESLELQRRKWKAQRDRELKRKSGARRNARIPPKRKGRKEAEEEEEDGVSPEEDEPSPESEEESEGREEDGSD